MVPDVSYNAAPWTGYTVYMSGSGIAGWSPIGGTSAGAPQWAALMALVNGARTTPLAGPGSVLYQLGSSSTASPYFRDVTSGSNGEYNAGIGYDEVTGLGSPKADALVAALVAQ